MLASRSVRACAPHRPKRLVRWTSLSLSFTCSFMKPSRRLLPRFVTPVINQPRCLVGVALLLLLPAICASAQTPRTNVALSSNGAIGSASSEMDANRTALAAINGDRRGIHWGSDPATGSGWHDATNNDYTNDWLQVDFNGSKTIDEIDVFSVQDTFWAPVERPRFLARRNACRIGKTPNVRYERNELLLQIWWFSGVG